MNYDNIKVTKTWQRVLQKLWWKPVLYQISKKELKLGWDRKNRTHGNELQMSRKESF